MTTDRHDDDPRSPAVPPADSGADDASLNGLGEAFFRRALALLAGELSPGAARAFRRAVAGDLAQREAFAAVAQLWEAAGVQLRPGRDLWPRVRSWLAEDRAIARVLRVVCGESPAAESAALRSACAHDAGLARLMAQAEALFGRGQHALPLGLATPKRDLWPEVRARIARRSARPVAAEVVPVAVSSRRRRRSASRNTRRLVLERRRTTARTGWVVGITLGLALLVGALILWQSPRTDSPPVAASPESGPSITITITNTPGAIVEPPAPAPDGAGNARVRPEDDGSPAPPGAHNQPPGAAVTPPAPHPRVPERSPGANNPPKGTQPPLPKPAVDGGTPDDAPLPFDPPADDHPRESADPDHTVERTPAAPAAPPVTEAAPVPVAFRYRVYQSGLPFTTPAPLGLTLTTPEARTRTLPLPTRSGAGVRFTQQDDGRLAIDANGDGQPEVVRTPGRTYYERFTLRYPRPERRPLSVACVLALTFDPATRGWFAAPAGVMQARTPLGRRGILALIDANLNGRYNDLGQDFVGLVGERVAMPLAAIIRAGERLFNLAVAPSGRAASATPWSGPAGVLIVDDRYQSGARLASVTLRRTPQAGLATSGTAAPQSCVVTLTRFDDVIPLPAGSYALIGGLVVNGRHRIAFGPARHARPGPASCVDVQADEIATLALGGPLSLTVRGFTPSVDASFRAAGEVVISSRRMQLVGAGGEEYRTLDGAELAPQFEFAARSADGRVRVIDASWRRSTRAHGKAWSYWRGAFPEFAPGETLLVHYLESAFSTALIGEAVMTDWQPAVVEDPKKSGGHAEGGLKPR